MVVYSIRSMVECTLLAISDTFRSITFVWWISKLYAKIDWGDEVFLFTLLRS